MKHHIQPITRDGYLTDQELVSVYSTLWVHRHDPDWEMQSDIVRMILGGGFRVSEICGLRKPEDCTQDGIIIVRKSKTGRMRQVRVTPEYLPWYKAKWHSLPNGLWFPRSEVNGRGYHRPYSTRRMQQLWADVLAAASVRPLSIHAGRHTYATWELATRRLLLHEVQAQLGHSSSRMTQDFYLHSVTECLYEDAPPAWRSVAVRGPEIKQLLKAV